MEEEIYKKMYYHLFNETTKMIEILKNAQITCEQYYIEANENDKENHNSLPIRHKI